MTPKPLTIIHQYIQAGTVAVAGKVFVLASGLGVLWFLNKIGGKEQFGLFMIALSYCLLVGGVLASGFQSLILYHGSRHHGAGRHDESRQLAGQCFFFSIALALLVMLITFVFSEAISNMAGKPELSQWLFVLVWMIPFHTGTLVLTTYQRAHQKIPAQVLYSEVMPFGLRFALLASVWFLGLPLAYSGAAFILSAFVPLACAYMRTPVPLVANFKGLTKWDVLYALKSCTVQLVNKPTRGLDMMLLAAFAPAAAAADYAVSLRLAQLLTIPKQSIAQLLVPRLGSYLESKSLPALWSEYDAGRQVTLLLTITGSLFFLVFGAPILSLFGGYRNALPILLILSLGHIINAGFGMVGGFASVAGYAGRILLIGIISSACVLALSFVFIPSLGGTGAALAILGGNLLTMSGFALLVHRYFDKIVCPLVVLFSTILAAAGLLGMAFDLLPFIFCMVCVMMSLVLVLLFDRSLIGFLRDYGTSMVKKYGT